MKSKSIQISFVICLVLFLASLFMPYYALYPHMDLDQEVISAFPSSISGVQIITSGTNLLPIDKMPVLALIPMRGKLLLSGVVLTLLGAALTRIRRHLGAVLSVCFGAAGAVCLFVFDFFTQQMDGSLLFSVMMTSKWYVWLAFVAALGLFIIEILGLRSVPLFTADDRIWRRLSAALAIAALLMMFLPFAVTDAPEGLFSTERERALATRSLNGWQWITGSEALLSEISETESAFGDPMSTETMQQLTRLSASGQDIRNLFKIPTHTGGIRSVAMAGVILLAISAALGFIPKVDRWIPAGFSVVSALLLLSESVGTLPVDAFYQFQGATAQLMYLGFGGYTIAALAVSFVAVLASISAILGIRTADSPYFVNPIPENRRMWTLSFCLAAVSVVMLLIPMMKVNLYTPGKVNRENPALQASVSGWALVTFQKPESVMEPVNNRGKALYTQEAAKNGLTLSDFGSVMNGALNRLGALVAVALLLGLFSIFCLIRFQQNKRLAIAAILSVGVMDCLMCILSTGVLPRDVGHISWQAPIFISMGTAAFSAFFAGFMDRAALPKKYKLFLMLLPFLVAVFLFSYLPLSGWRYAFYNYKLGLPMDQQEYVGFKWFTTMFQSPAQRQEMFRVLRNTFAMSGLGLITSWMPVAFAIFLTEIKTGWYKKFVQIFTTLPNFISWVLVFSFALTIFSLDTGIVNKALLQFGLIQEPIAYLNSGDHIWLKMWLWNMWKSLGWSAIMYLAAIAGIDQELYEAAKVDGAGRWRQIRHITIPGLLPTFFVLLLLSISNVVNNGMEQYLVFQNAMNKSTIEVLDLYVFNISLGSRSSNTISMATAIGILKSLVSVVLLFMANRFSKLVRGESIV